MMLVAKPYRALALALGSILFLIAICTLPYRVPLAPVYSISYIFGYNNRVAVLLTAGAIVLLALFGPTLQLSFRSGKPLTVSTLRKALAIAGGCTVILAWFTRRLDGLLESIYLIDRARLLGEGRVPYRDFEYAYGAFFLYGPSWIARWTHLSVGDAYGLFWIGLVLLGTWLLYKCLTWTDLPGAAQRTVFLFFWAFSVVNLLTFGITYTTFRYILPCFLALVLYRRLAVAGDFHAAVLLLPVPMFALLIVISPELAIAFGVGVSAFLARFGRLRIGKNVAAFLISLAAMGIIGFLAARWGVFYTLAAFSHGANNIPVMPAPHLLLLFFLTGLAACYAGQRLKLGRPDALTMLIAVSACDLAAALGSCDSLHALLNPLGVLLAGTLLLSGLPRVRSFVWPAMWIVFILLRLVTLMSEWGLQYEKAALPALLTLPTAAYRARVENLVYAHMAKSLGPTLARTKLDNLEAAMGQRQYDVPAIFHQPARTIFAAPFGFAPGGFGAYHTASIDEGFYFENENVVTPDAVVRKIDEMRVHPERPLLLLPGRENACTVTVAAGRPTIGPPFYYPYLGKPVHNNDLTEPICAFLRQNYHVAMAAAPSTLGYALWLPNGRQG